MVCPRGVRQARIVRLKAQRRQWPASARAGIGAHVLLTGVNAFLALVSLAALIGIWFGPPIGAVAQVPPR